MISLDFSFVFAMFSVTSVTQKTGKSAELQINHMSDVKKDLKK